MIYDLQRKILQSNKKNKHKQVYVIYALFTMIFSLFNESNIHCIQFSIVSEQPKYIHLYQNRKMHTYFH